MLLLILLASAICGGRVISLRRRRPMSVLTNTQPTRWLGNKRLIRASNLLHNIGVHLETTSL